MVETLAPVAGAPVASANPYVVAAVRAALPGLFPPLAPFTPYTDPIVPQTRGRNVVRGGAPRGRLVNGKALPV